MWVLILETMFGCFNGIIGTINEFNYVWLGGGGPTCKFTWICSCKTLFDEHMIEVWVS